MSDAREIVEKIKQQREERQNLVEFRWCEMIREAGILYQETDDIFQVARDIDRGEDRTKEALKLFQLIYSYPLDIASTRAYGTGIRFFVQEENIDNISEEEDLSLKDTKDCICEFVGALYQEYDFGEVDLEDPPKEFTGKTRTQAMIEATAECDWQPIQEAIQSATKTVNRIDINFEDLAASLQSIKEHYSEIQQVLESSIQEIDDPGNYDPNDVDIDPKAQEIGIESTASFLKNVDESDRNTLDGYISRIKKGIEAYQDGEYMLACFIFISVQDGLMEMLCSEQERTPAGDGYYTSSQKREVLKGIYEQIDRGYYGVDASKIQKHLEDFWDHRNAIMHGDLVAHFDENIATVSLLFLMFTLYTIIETVPDENQS